MEISTFYENDLLFGYNRTKYIVACELTENGDMEVFFRNGGTVSSEIQKFRPFIFLEDTKYLIDCKIDFEDISLKGDEYYKYLIFTENWEGLLSIVKFLNKKTGYTSASFQAPFYFLNDPIHQHLLLTGETFFKGMRFNDLVRLQLDIETFCKEGYEFSNPHRVEDRIIVISISDTRGWERVISGKDFSEKEMIEGMIKEINNRDPDIIEGHNIFNFDFNYIDIRAKMHKIPLKLGRNTSIINSRSSRLTIAERNISYKRFDIYGRHILDTYQLVQMYDVYARSLEGFGLKEVARHFNIARPERTYIMPERINWFYNNDIETLLKYAIDDVRETKGISEILSQSFFYQAQIFPYSFQNIIVRGNATKINSLFLREYMRSGYSIPKPLESKDEIVGGYTDIFTQGVIKRVLHCDVQSLYPSIMLAFRYFPKKDILAIFPLLLNDLKDFRVQAKECKKHASSKDEENYFEALQATFKILINSFYGYLGFGYGHFSDFEQANNVTTKGRELICEMVQWLKKKGCEPIEIDTDGIYFVPPGHIKTTEDEEGLIKELSDTLPKGINLELAGRYKTMFSYKIKNYVLLDYNDHLIIKGSGLKSRGFELFQRRFMEEMFELLLNGKSHQIDNLLNKYIDNLMNHRWDKAMFIKKETLQESLDVYMDKVKKRLRAPSASYELALRSDRNYQPGDIISYYVTGSDKRVKVFENCKPASEWNKSNPDENLGFYKAKLLELYKKFKPFFK